MQTISDESNTSTKRKTFIASKAMFVLKYTFKCHHQPNVFKNNTIEQIQFADLL